MKGDFRVGEWLVQPRMNRIVGASRTAGLEFKSMEVLRRLADARGEVVSRQELIQAVWPDTFVTDDVLNHAISQLRKAFGDTPKNSKVIQTLARRGYRLIPAVSDLPPAFQHPELETAPAALQLQERPNLPAVARKAPHPSLRRRTALMMAAAFLFLISTLIYGSLEIRRARDRTAVARQHADRDSAKARRLAYRASLLEAEDAIVAGDVDLAAERLGEAPEERRGWEWRHLRSRTNRSFRVLTGHEGIVDWIAFSSDGKTLATGSGADRTARLWRFTEDASISAQHQPAFVRLRPGLDEDSSVRAAQPTDRRLVWSASADLSEINVEEVRSFSWVDRRRRFLLSLDPAACRWEGNRQTCRLVLKTMDGDRTLASRDWTSSDLEPLSGRMARFSPDGLLVLLWRAGDAELLDGATLETRLRIPTCRDRPAAPPFSLQDGAIAPNGETALLISADSRIRAFRLPDGQALYQVNANSGSLHTLEISPDGTIFATAGEDQLVRLWTTESGELLRTLGGQRSAVAALVFSPDGNWLASAGEDSTIHLWRLGDAANPQFLRGRHTFVHPVAFSPDGSRIFSGGWNGHLGTSGPIRVWGRQGEPLASWGDSDSIVFSLALSPDGSLLAVGASRWVDNPPRLDNHRVEVLDSSTGQRIQVLKNFPADVNSVAFHPDGRRLLVGAHSIQLWDPVSGRRLRELAASSQRISFGGRAAFSPDGKWIAAAVDGTDLRLWETDGKEQRSLESSSGKIINLAFSADGSQLLATCWDERIRVWDVNSGRMLREIASSSAAPAYALAFSPDGARLASAGKAGVVRIWDTSTLEELVGLRGHQSYVYSLAWDPRGDGLISGAGDGTVGIWR